jgi:high-affinity iron transporter
LLVLLREGVEAILLVAVMVAVVRKTGRHDAMRYLHAGWIAALVAGLATWFVAGKLIEATEARRELTEGVAALLAASMLLYVGFWLHKRSHLQAWEAFIRDRVTAALGRQTSWAIAGVAFLAIYRELLEIVLLYQALWVRSGGDGQRALLAGVATAAVLLALLAWLVVRYSERLPVARFHAVASTLLVAMALVFVGDGIAALQEAGVVPLTAVRFVTVEPLGIHPTAQGLAAQALVAALIAVALVMNRRRRA